MHTPESLAALIESKLENQTRNTPSYRSGDADQSSSRESPWYVKVFSFIVIGLMFSLPFLGQHYLPILLDVGLNYVAIKVIEVIGVIVILILGLALFWFREAYPLRYGILEIAFALATAWFTLERIDLKKDREISTWLGLGSAAYLIVRGADNISKASKPTTKEQIARIQDEIKRLKQNSKTEKTMLQQLNELDQPHA